MTETTEPTLEALRKRAGELDVDGRSTMDREALESAIVAAEAAKAAEAQSAAAAASKAVEVAGDVGELAPGTPAQTGRPDLVEVAQERAANRKLNRVVGDVDA